MSLSGNVIKIPLLVLWKECCCMWGCCIADISVLYLCMELRFSVPAIKGCRAALNHILSLLGTDLTANWVISKMFSSCKRKCLLREIKPSQWNLAPVLRSLMCLPYGPPKLSFDMHLTWKTCFLLALVFTKKVSELHGLSYLFTHFWGWRSHTFSFVPKFLVRTLNPSVSDPRWVYYLFSFWFYWWESKRDVVLFY